jgi:serralysin
MSGALSLSGYQLTFDDEFADDTNSDIGKPGTSGIKWETEPFYGDTSNGGQGTINPTPPGQPGSLYSFQNGYLVLSMDPQQAPYLDTNPNGVQGGLSQQYGYFEIRAQLTGTSGYNADFWMIPSSGGAPPEIDVFEHNGYIAGDYEMTYHSSTSPVHNLDLYEVPGVTTGFHDFGVMWTPDTLTWYIDGQAVFSSPKSSGEDRPLSLILSGGPSYESWLPEPAGGSSDQYKIQWVHAYSKDPNATEIAGTPSYKDHDGSASLGGSSNSSTGNSGTTGGSSSTDGGGLSGGGSNSTDAGGSSGGSVSSNAGSIAPGSGSLNSTSAGGMMPSVTETSDHGSLQKDLSTTGTYTVGDDTLVLSSSNVASVNLGTGTSKIAFVDPNSLSVTGGPGSATVTANAGTNTFTAGAGSLDVTGGSGSDSYVFHTGSGLLTIQDFSADKGDKIVIDSALQASMVQGSDDQGGTLITFGSGAAQAIHLRGVATIPTGAITWA